MCKLGWTQYVNITFKLTLFSLCITGCKLNLAGMAVKLHTVCKLSKDTVLAGFCLECCVRTAYSCVEHAETK